MNPPPEEEEAGRTALTAGCGAALGLAAGVVLAQGVSWAAFFLLGEPSAEVVWQVLSPLLALALAVVGALYFRHRFGEAFAVVLPITLVLLAALIAFCFWLGFPFSGT